MNQTAWVELYAGPSSPHRLIHRADPTWSIKHQARASQLSKIVPCIKIYLHNLKVFYHDLHAYIILIFYSECLIAIQIHVKSCFRNFHPKTCHSCGKMIQTPMSTQRAPQNYKLVHLLFGVPVLTEQILCEKLTRQSTLLSPKYLTRKNYFQSIPVSDYMNAITQILCIKSKGFKRSQLGFYV